MDLQGLRQRARVRARRGIEVVWREYVAWLTATFPRIAASLAAPDPRADEYIDTLQQVLGVPVPAELATLYRLTGGEPVTFRGDGADEIGRGALFGSRLMTPAEVVDEARAPGTWRADGLDGDQEDPDCPAELLEPTRVRPGWRHRLWLRVLDTDGGNYGALDLAPGPMGAPGQVINVGRDQGQRFVVADTLTEFIALLHELGELRHVHVVESLDFDDVDDDDDDGDEDADAIEGARGALFFGPSEYAVIDQLRVWAFPAR